MLTKLIAIVMLIFLSFLNAIFIMIYGWGLEMKSLPVIVIGFFITVLLTTLIQIVNNDKT